MLVRLTCHPDTPCAEIERIDVELGRGERGALRLRYRIVGDAEHVLTACTSPGEPPQRRDELWRHTCCELFVREPAGEGYREYNFAPGGDWAAYRFGGYRAGMSPLDAAAPRIVLERSPAMLALTVTLDDQPLSALGGRQIAIACVLEATSPGGRSYWALAHPPGRPDFHHPAAFALTLAVEHTADSLG